MFVQEQNWFQHSFIESNQVFIKEFPNKSFLGLILINYQLLQTFWLFNDDSIWMKSCDIQRKEDCQEKISNMSLVGEGWSRLATGLPETWQSGKLPGTLFTSLPPLLPFQQVNVTKFILCCHQHIWMSSYSWLYLPWVERPSCTDNVDTRRESNLVILRMLVVLYNGNY